MSASFDYHTIKNWKFPVKEQTYTEKDSILYALGAGYSTSPMDPRALAFVYEKDLKAVPTMSVVLGYPGFWMQDPASGVDWVQVVHGEQNVTIHQPLPPAATIVGRSKVLSVTDKGEGKGALVVFETQVTERDSGTLLATVSQVVFCRAEGGYSNSGQPSDPFQPPKVTFPDRAPDYVCDLPTGKDMALIYRLSGDMNPLHADPEVATAAGFEGPILHGLATFAVAGHAILKECCGYQAERLKVMNARFSAPVYPGETIRTEIWNNGDSLCFRSSVLERGIMVLNNGYVELA